MEEDLALNEANQARVAAVRRWCEDTVTLRLDAAPPPFAAGQFVRLGLPTKGRPLLRSYSMASAPGEPPEFLVERVPGGALSPRLCALNPGATLLWDPRPAGRFTLERVGSGESLWLVATGAGLAPFVSMLRSGEPWRRFRRVVLVHAVAHPGQLAYREELAALGAARGDGWASLARTGADATPEALAAALADGRLEAAAGAPLDARAQVLLCGDPRVLDAARAALEARGLRRNRPRAPGQITSEKYWA